MTAKKIINVVIIAVIFILNSSFLILHSVKADELEEINQKLEELKKARAMSEAATKPLESTLQKLKGDLDNILIQIKSIEADLQKKKERIENGEQKLDEQEKLLAKRVKSFYIRRSQINSLAIIFSRKTPGEWLRELAYQKAATNEDKRVIIEIVLYIKDLENKKKELESENKRLAVIKSETDKQAAFFQKEIIGAKAYQENLSNEIAVLSARQQQLVAQRLAALNIPRSAGTSTRGCLDDRGVDPGFSPGFALFSYGAPHRVGLNQYGAKGRSEGGQSRDDILRAYFQNFEITKWDTNIKIKVQGKEEFFLEDYVLRIYEMPEDWPIAALEAQAIAARSYALAYTGNGANEICTTESCQVFGDNPKTGQWAQAVKNTEGLVMTSGGNPVKAWYASTHGGYIYSSGEIWGGETSYTKHAIDTSTGSVGSFGDLQSNAYDRSSPWFYCDWGARSQNNNTAWLKPEEVADITNVILLARKDSSTGEHLYQTDKSHPYGGEVWNEDRVKQELRSKGLTPYNNVSDISVGADFNSGQTTSINISGDAGTNSFSGDEFKNWFNLRAPANIQIVGPLFNVEKR